jgi:hypothetical protein
MAEILHANKITERGMLGCTLCGRPLRETASWKGRGERYYCSEFCADAEPIDIAGLVPQTGTPTLARASRKAAGGGFHDHFTASNR